MAHIVHPSAVVETDSPNLRNGWLDAGDEMPCSTRAPSWLTVLALTALVALAPGACSPSRAIEAADVLADVAAGDGPSRLKRLRPEPKRTPVVYQVAGRRHAGDIYEPGDGAVAALVLVPGVARAGKDDPRLVAFAKTLARARFAVLVPDIENLRALKVSRADAGNIADAVQYLARRGGTGEDPSVGLVAISYAVGPALLAALEENTGRRVRFVLAIGGYYDIEAVVTFFTTGYFREQADGPWRHLEPNAYGKWIFVRNNADRLTARADRAALADIAERKLKNLTAEIGDLVAKLGPEGRAVHALLVNDDPQRAPALIAALPLAVRADMVALDLKNQDLSKLAARLILVHGRDDAIIPYSESKALAAVAPRAELYVVDSLAHVDLGLSGLIDTVVLWRAVYRLLAERDAAPPPAR